MHHLIPIKNCRRTLDFSPENGWPPALPVFCFNNELLCGFDRLEGMAVELQSEELSAAIKAIYPELSFPELARLTSKESLNSDLIRQIWETYGYRFKETLQETAQQVLKLPMNAQRWLHLKKFGPQDLAVLRSLTTVDVLNPFWPHLLEGNFSKSDGAKIIELVVELLLMERPLAELLPPAEKAQWLKRLHELRYPMITQNDQQSEKKVRTIAWPLKSEAKWVRRGDRAGVELKLFFSHPQELKRSLERLQQVCGELQTESVYEDLWSKN